MNRSVLARVLLPRLARCVELDGRPVIADVIRTREMSRRRITVLTIVTMLAIATGLIIWGNLGGPSFLRAYRSLQLGMSTTQVQASFKRGPDYTYTVGKSTVWYLAAPQAFPRPAAITAPANGSLVPNAASLPDTYDYVTLAFDANNKLIAFTWIGETYTVEYVGGSRQGTHFRMLPDGYL